MAEHQNPPWRASWIWARRNPEQPNSYVYFRRAFSLATVPREAHCRVTADSEYKLWINGRAVGAGPMMTEPRWKSYDSYDVAALLRPGENVVAAIAYHYGNGLDGHEPLTLYPSHGGFLLQLDSRTDEDEPYSSLLTDGSWLALEETAWRSSPGGRKLDRTTYPEHYDARLEPLGWLEPGFAANGWRAAFVVGSDKGELQTMNVAPSLRLPWVHLEPRSIPPLEVLEAYPRAVQSGEVRQLGINDPAVQSLAQEILPSRHTAVERADLLAQAPPRSAVAVMVRPMDPSLGYDQFEGVYDPVLLVDFGRCLNGRLCFEVEGPAGATLLLTYGQRLIGGKVMPYFSPGTVYADSYTLREGRQRFESFNWRHFRYLQVSFPDLARPLTLHALSARELRYPYRETGSFACSDETVSWVWRACVETARLCTLDRFMDNPFRERREYTSDVANILYAVYAAFGDPAIVRKYFRDVLRGALGYQLIPSGVLGHRSEFNRTLTDGDSFVLRIWDHYQCFGDKAVVSEMFDLAYGSVKSLEQHATPDGLLAELPYCVWFDWADIELKGVSTIINAVFLGAQAALASMAEALGKADIAAEYRGKVAARSALLNRLTWDEAQGAFVDGLVDGRKTHHTSEHANYLMVLFGFADPEQTAGLVRFFRDPPAEAGQIESCQLWPMAGLFEAGEGAQAVAELRKRFGRIRAQGLDTVSETWYLDGMKRAGRWRCSYNRSAVQSGGTIAAYLLSRYVLGIAPGAPGFASVRVAPQTCGLAWAQGSWPSPRGEIGVRWEMEEKGGARVFRIRCSLPDGVPGTLILPFGEELTAAVRRDGVILDPVELAAGELRLRGETMVEQVLR